MKEQRSDKKSFKELMGSFRNRRFRGGIFTFAVCIVVVIFVVILNIVFGKLDITADMTSNSLYSISSESKEFAKSITDTIRFYYFAETGQENAQINKLVAKYNGLGKDMKIVYVDPVLHPNYAAGLVGQEEATQVGADTVIVVNETNGRTKVVTSSELIKTDYSIDYSTYSYVTTTSVDVENEIDSALLYVTTPDLPKVYYTSGHGEVNLSTVLTTLFDDNNIILEELDTLTAEEIPSDCDILFMYLPAYDLTAGEAELIKAYLAAGGKAVFNVCYVTAEQPNIKSLLEYYGLQLNEGVVCESNNKYYTSRYPNYLLPVVETADATSGVQGVKRVFAPYSSGLTESDNIRSTISITSLLTTTDTSFSKVDTESGTASKVAGVDIDGPFMIGAYITEETESGTTELYVYSSLYMFDENILSESSYGNSDVCLNTFKTLADIETSFNIPAKSTEAAYLQLSEAQINLHRNIKMILIPALCMIAGIVIWVSRRRAV